MIYFRNALQNGTEKVRRAPFYEDALSLKPVGIQILQSGTMQIATGQNF